MTIKKNDIIDAISKMNVLELADLIKDIEKKFNISSENINKLSSSQSSKKEINEEKKDTKVNFSVIMTDYGNSKINVIKTIRTILSLGLKEAKDFVEKLPVTVKKDVKKEEADNIKEKLEKSGAKIELK